MKTGLLLLVALVLGIHTLQAQDLIVTSEGDSINCKITKQKENHLYFTFKHGDEIRNTLLPMNQITAHQYNFYPETVAPEVKKIRSNDYSRWRLAFNGGFSKETARISNQVPAQQREFVEDLMSGTNISADVNYYFSESIGAGFKYLNFSSSTDVATTPYRTEEFTLDIDFIGPCVSTRLLNASKKNALFLNMGIGYVSYHFDLNSSSVKGKTAGLLYDVGYDIGISEKMSIGLQLSYLMGQLSKYEMIQGNNKQTVELEEGNYESLNRLDFSVGIRFNL